MLSLNELRIDASSIGKVKYLAAVSPYYKYDENKNRTDIIEGYKYEVALPEVRYEKIAVKIPGEKQLEYSGGSNVPVDFSDLEIKAYIISGNAQFSAKASKITKVKA